MPPCLPASAKRSKLSPSQHFGGSRRAQVPTARLTAPAPPKSFSCEEHGSTIDCHGLVCAPGASGGEQQCLDIDGNFTVCRSGTSVQRAAWWLGVYVWYLKKNQGVDTPHCKNCRKSWTAEPVRQDLAQLKWPSGMSQWWGLYGPWRTGAAPLCAVK